LMYTHYLLSSEPGIIGSGIEGPLNIMSDFTIFSNTDIKSGVISKNSN
jgi:hypothetical protein